MVAGKKSQGSQEQPEALTAVNQSLLTSPSSVLLRGNGRSPGQRLGETRLCPDLAIT